MELFGGKKHTDRWNVTDRRKQATSRNHYNRRKPKKCERHRKTSLFHLSQRLGGEKVAGGTSRRRRRVKKRGNQIEQGARRVVRYMTRFFSRPLLNSLRNKILFRCSVLPSYVFQFKCKNLENFVILFVLETDVK